MRPVRIFIGWDSREQDAARVAASSLCRHSSLPLEITFLKQEELRAQGLYSRPEGEPASTEFAFTRFLVPHLCEYEGFAVFFDCDFLFTRDIAELWPHCNRRRGAAVHVVKHDYTPRAAFKMDGEPQVPYPRKNWSSLMVFKCDHAYTRRLTPEYVNSAKAADLQQFAWAPARSINDLPTEWNWLEGEYEWGGENPPAVVHFTNGGPWHVNHKSVRYGDLWTKELARIGGGSSGTSEL